jgi:hypothetical protein
MALTFERLLAEAVSVPVVGWDFSWFEGRATEERPSWGYSGLLAARMVRVDTAVDLQTGGGEVPAGISRVPRLLVATESWPPNLEIARRNLRPLGACSPGPRRKLRACWMMEVFLCHDAPWLVSRSALRSDWLRSALWRAESGGRC